LFNLASSLYGSGECLRDSQELTDLDGLVNVVKLISYAFRIHTGEARAGVLAEVQLCWARLTWHEAQGGDMHWSMCNGNNSPSPPSSLNPMTKTIFCIHLMLEGYVLTTLQFWP